MWSKGRKEIKPGHIWWLQCRDCGFRPPDNTACNTVVGCPECKGMFHIHTPDSVSEKQS